MGAGPARKQARVPDPEINMDKLDVAQLGLHSMADFDALLERFAPELADEDGGLDS